MILRTQRPADETTRVDSNNQTRWNVILLVSTTLLTSSLSLHAVAQETMTVRDAAARMMGASAFVPGVAAYCNERVVSNKPLLEAARDWNVRNKRFMDQTISVLRVYGDISSEQKDRLNRAGYKLGKDVVEREPDPKQFCSDLTYVVKSGALDLDRREDLAEARTMIRAAPSNSRATETESFVQQLQTKCDKGIARACDLLGYGYYRGLERENRDATKAAFLFGKACDGGDPAGCLHLGLLAQSGEGTTQDLVRAVALFKQSCDGGDAYGCGTLAFAYSLGKGVSKNPWLAAEFARKGCEGGDGIACEHLGMSYLNGEGVEQNFFQAVDLFRKACTGESASGCNLLGVTLQYGKGVKQNNTEALKYFGKACDLKMQRG